MNFHIIAFHFHSDSHSTNVDSDVSGFQTSLDQGLDQGGWSWNKESEVRGDILKEKVHSKNNLLLKDAEKQEKQKKRRFE